MNKEVINLQIDWEYKIANLIYVIRIKDRLKKYNIYEYNLYLKTIWFYILIKFRNNKTRLKFDKVFILIYIIK